MNEVYHLVKRMKDNDEWKFFEQYFKGRSAKVFDEMRAKAGEITQEELISGNAKMLCYEEFSNLYNYLEREMKQKEIKKTWSGKGVLDQLASWQSRKN